MAFRFLFYFTAAGVKCRVAAVKRLPVLHRSADYIFISFGIIELILVTLKIDYIVPLSLANYIVAFEET